MIAEATATAAVRTAKAKARTATAATAPTAAPASTLVPMPILMPTLMPTPTPTKIKASAASDNVATRKGIRHTEQRSKKKLTNAVAGAGVHKNEGRGGREVKKQVLNPVEELPLEQVPRAMPLPAKAESERLTIVGLVQAEKAWWWCAWAFFGCLGACYCAQREMRRHAYQPITGWGGRRPTKAELEARWEGRG